MKARYTYVLRITSDPQGMIPVNVHGRAFTSQRAMMTEWNQLVIRNNIDSGARWYAGTMTANDFKCRKRVSWQYTTQSGMTYFACKVKLEG